MRLRRTVALGGLLVGIACGRSAFVGSGLPGTSGTPTKGVTPTPSGVSSPTPPPFSFRRLIVVSAGTAAAPAGYSFPVTFDHAQMVTAGKSLASGDDVRVLVASGGNLVETDRVLDSGSAWNLSNTTVWFKLPAAVAALSTNDTSFLYYGDPNATSPPQNPGNVFLFYDGFESGTTSLWTTANPANFTVVSNLGHNGTHSLFMPGGSACNLTLVANGLSASNMRFDAWWYLTSFSGIDLAQSLRVPSGSYDDYETDYVDGNGGFDIAQYQASGSNFNEFAGPPSQSTPPTSTWFRISLAIDGTGFEVLDNGAQVVPKPTATPFDLSGKGTSLSAGSVGFRICHTGNGWWVDDATVRSYVTPEPAVLLGAEGPVP